MTEQTQMPTKFITYSTAIAAYLQSEGFILEIDASNPRNCKFCFENNDPKLIELVHKFESGKAEGSISTFFFCYKRLLTRIREASNG